MNSSMERSDACDGRGSCEFQQNIDILRQVPLFSALSLEPVKVLAYLASRETYKPGEILFHQGESDGQAFYLIEGNARLVRETDGALRELTEYGPGAFLGGLALLGDMRRLFSLRAETPVTALVLSREKFAKTLEQFPDIQPKLLEAVVESIREWEKHFVVDHAGACAQCAAYLGVSAL